MVPDFLHGAPPTDACAAFIKESRMKFVNARELDRNPGVRWANEGHPSRERRASFFPPTTATPTNSANVATPTCFPNLRPQDQFSHTL